ncbi:MAG TPA: hypothetical protein VGK23_08675 [Methanomassiliicoccales archaeon]|jgi:hypothetical protein
MGGEMTRDEFKKALEDLRKELMVEVDRRIEDAARKRACACQLSKTRSLTRGPDNPRQL